MPYKRTGQQAGPPIRGHSKRAPLRVGVEEHLHPLIREAAELDEISIAEWVQRACVKQLREMAFEEELITPAVRDDPPPAPTPIEPRALETPTLEAPSPPLVDGRLW